MSGAVKCAGVAGAILLGLGLPGLIRAGTGWLVEPVRNLVIVSSVMVLIGSLLSCIWGRILLREKKRNDLLELVARGALPLPKGDVNLSWVRLSTHIKETFGIERRSDDHFPPTPEMSAGQLNQYLTSVLNDRLEFMSLPLYADLQAARIAAADTAQRPSESVPLHTRLDALFPRYRRASLWRVLRQKCPDLSETPELGKAELLAIGWVGVAGAFAIEIPAAQWFDQNYPIEVSRGTRLALRPLGWVIFAGIALPLQAMMIFGFYRLLLHAPPGCKTVAQIAVVSAEKRGRVPGQWTHQETWSVLGPLIANAFCLGRARSGVDAFAAHPEDFTIVGRRFGDTTASCRDVGSQVIHESLIVSDWALHFGHTNFFPTR